eukprot:3177650-Alexandrium_andersonii.AAC.1
MSASLVGSEMCIRDSAAAVAAAFAAAEAAAAAVAAAAVAVAAVAAAAVAAAAAARRPPLPSRTPLPLPATQPGWPDLPSLACPTAWQAGRPSRHSSARARSSSQADRRRRATHLLLATAAALTVAVAAVAATAAGRGSLSEGQKARVCGFASMLYRTLPWHARGRFHMLAARTRSLCRQHRFQTKTRCTRAHLQFVCGILALQLQPLSGRQRNPINLGGPGKR